MQGWRGSWPAQRRRAARLAPLFAYLDAHGIRHAWLCRRLVARRGYALYSAKFVAIRRGYCVTPPHFIADCCRELERSPHDVMGPAWMATYGAALAAEEAEDAGEAEDVEDAAAALLL